MDFSLETLTAAINDMPYLPTQLGASGLFSYDGIPTLTVYVERQGSTLSLVPTAPRGAPGVEIGRDQRSMKPFQLAHLPMHDSVWADEVQGVRAFGSAAAADPFQARVDRVMAKGKEKLSYTLEHMRVGALKGIVLDADGSVIANLFNDFGTAGTPLAKTEFTISLAADTTKVRALCSEVTDLIGDKLDGVMSTGFEGWVNGPTFRALVEHKMVRDTYLNQSEAASLRGEMPDSIDIGGITWRKYRGMARGLQMIETGKGYVVPKGVPDLFLGRFGPANYMETVNTDGLPVYAKGIDKRNGTGVDIEMQSNPFHCCTRPQAVCHVTFTMPA
jgi:hypothetical protein